MTTNIQCELNGVQVECVEPIYPNTAARISCAFGYEEPLKSNLQKIIRCQASGEWDYYPFKCVPQCGVLTPSVTGLITKGEDAPISKVPWHVAIYEKKDDFSYICGGTIISPRLVISAAHCFWGVDDFKDKKLYQVGVGKYFRDYNAIEKISPQFFNITDMISHVGYQDFDGNYNLDIVVLVLSSYILLKPHVRPVCIERTLFGEEKSVPTGWQGLIVGFGLITGTQLATSLRMATLKTIHREDCIAQVPPQSRNFVTGDKFCAGDTKEGVVACQGDSGGGFVRSKNINGQDYYYLIGIVSSGGASSLIGECNTQEAVRFTNVHYYDELIVKTEGRYPIE